MLGAINPYLFTDQSVFKAKHFHRLPFAQFKWQWDGVIGGDWHVMPPEHAATLAPTKRQHPGVQPSGTPLGTTDAAWWAEYWAARLSDVMGEDLTRYAGKAKTPFGDLVRTGADVDWATYVQRVHAKVNETTTGKLDLSKYHDDHVKWVVAYNKIIVRSKLDFAGMAVEAILKLSRCEKYLGHEEISGTLKRRLLQVSDRIQVMTGLA